MSTGRRNMKHVQKPKSVSRRKILKGMASAGAILAAPSILSTPLRRARAATTPGTIHMLASPTVALEDWSQFEKDTGLKMDFKPFTVDDVGALMNEVVVNGGGERYDIIS